MNKRSTLKKSLSLFVCTLLAVSCANNVKAAPSKVVKVETSYTTSSNDTTSSSTSGTTGNTNLKTSNFSNNGVCDDFTVNRVKRIKNDPYASDGLAFNIYSVTPSCTSTSGQQYIAFCINPELDGVTKPTIYHANQTLDLNTMFGKYMFTLYHLYKQSGSCTDDACIARWQAAARRLQYDSNEFQVSRSAATYKTAYDNWKSGNISGSEYANAVNIANQVKATYQNVTANSGNLTVDVEQVGDTTYQGGSSFTAKYNVILTNTTGYTGIQTPSIVWKNGNDVTSGYNYSFSGPTTDGDTITYELTVTGALSSGDCTAKTMEIHIKYNNENDINGAFVISPANNQRRQRFAVFEVGTTGEKVAATVVNPNNSACNKAATSCTTSGGLVCESADGTKETVNEGVQPGTSSTDWEACIIGKTDEQGNAYDIQQQNDDMFIGTNGADENTDNILATLANGTKITDTTYCTISCKEQYDFNLPGGKKDVKQGTYIEFNTAGGSPYHAVAGVKSTRQCVTSGQTVSGSNVNNVNYKQYETIVTDLRKQQVDYLNSYLYYYAMYQKLTTLKDLYLSPVSQDGARAKTSDSIEGLRNDAYNVDPSTNSLNDKSYFAAYAFKDNVTFNVNLYTLTDGNSTKAEIKQESKTFKVNESINTAATKNEFTSYFIKTKNYNNIYEGKYTSSVFDASSNVEDNYSNKSGSYKYKETEVSHYASTATGGVPKDASCSADSHGNLTCTKEVERDGNYSYKITENDETAQYDAMMNRIQDAYNNALEKYNALSAQISTQVSSMATCSGYLDAETNKYNFDPSITFSYDQDNYMSMLGSSKLVRAGSATPSLGVTMHYCTGEVSNASDVFNCSTSKPESVKLYTLPTIDAGATSVTADENDYYQVSRIGSEASYTCADNGDGYCYYRSNTAFYTYPQDGLAVTKPVDNSTIIATDGYVYPVTITTQGGVHNYRLTFKNIGQYFESGSLGRIMGGNGGKIGTRSGEQQDYEACYYDVCPTTDPNCGNNKNNACAKVATSDICKNGNYGSMTTDELATCIKTLLNSKNDDGSTCCDEVNRIITSRVGGAVPSSVYPDYNAVCSPATTCKSFTIYNTSGNLYDVADVDNSGELQFTVRSVSLNNLFPNNVSGVNWQTDTAKNTASEIQSNGEAIYGNDPDYSVKLTPTCIAAIREYNSEQSDSGGLSDFTGYISTSSEYKAGSASYSTFLTKLNDMGCVYSGTKTENIDSIK
jgi:hypothetical protein